MMDWKEMTVAFVGCCALLAVFVFGVASCEIKRFDAVTECSRHRPALECKEALR